MLMPRSAEASGPHHKYCPACAKYELVRLNMNLKNLKSLYLQMNYSNTIKGVSILRSVVNGPYIRKMLVVKKWNEQEKRTNAM
jgi:hypothetical protein